jgi:hypothetical protein
MQVWDVCSITHKRVLFLLALFGCELGDLKTRLKARTMLAITRNTISLRQARRPRACSTTRRPVLRCAAAGATPSDVAETVMRTIDPATQRRCELLELLPGLNRGTLASASQRQEVSAAIARLETLACELDSLAMEGLLQGRWQLIYSTVVSLRGHGMSSPQDDSPSPHTTECCLRCVQPLCLLAGAISQQPILLGLPVSGWQPGRSQPNLPVHRCASDLTCGPYRAPQSIKCGPQDFAECGGRDISASSLMIVHSSGVYIRNADTCRRHPGC